MQLIIALIFFIGVALFAVLAAMYSGKVRKSKIKESQPTAIATGVLAGVFGLGLILVPSSIQTVEAGSVAVVKHLGEAKTIRKAGTYFDFWVTEEYLYYDATVQNLSISASAYSKDAQTMQIAMTVQYQIQEDALLKSPTNTARWKRWKTVFKAWRLKKQRQGFRPIRQCKLSKRAQAFRRR